MTDQTKPTRDDLRATIFGNKKFAKETVNFFGVDIELRQPSLAQIIAARAEDAQVGIINILVQYAYIPGTDEHVFEDTDADGLKSMPFGVDFLNVNAALEKLTSVNIAGEKSGSN